MKDPILLYKGKYGKVFITPITLKEFNKAFKNNPRTRSGILSKIQKYAEEGETFFTKTQFKSVGHFPKGGMKGGTVQVYEFIHKQARIYGCKTEDKKNFICLSSDKKQQNKANQKKLQKVAKDYATLF